MFFSPVCKISIKSVKSPNLLIICLAEIAQLRSLERRSLLRSWSSNPCQGWGREFESRFPLLAGQQHIAGLPFFIQGTRTRDMLPEGAAGQGRLRGLRKKTSTEKSSVNKKGQAMKPVLSCNVSARLIESCEPFVLFCPVSSNRYQRHWR